ncbi:TonB-dependent receptor domain-containing protein, partial [Burkholderia ubonensis]|uniref:TonB-dependent receptor domain-containing protein n=1 Tax=Burkholderia ubonensis TaxID=101571 RepID=UPI0012F92614
GLDGAAPTMAPLTRSAALFQFNYTRFDFDNRAQANFTTGPLSPTLLFGFDYTRQTTTDSEWLAKAPSINLYRPVYTPIPADIFSGPGAYPRTDTKTTLNVFGLYVQDQIKWQRWVLTLGGRQDWTRTLQDDIANSTSFKQNDHAFSGRVGLTYLGDYGLAPYISYSTSFNPQIGLKLSGGGLA